LHAEHASNWQACKSGFAKRVFLLEDIMISYKYMAEIFILKYFQEWYCKTKTFFKLCKSKAVILICVQESGRISKYYK
jgi:hypothetical protein